MTLISEPDESERNRLYWRAVSFVGEVEFFGAYLDEMEGFIEAQAQQYNEELEEIRERIRSGDLVLPSDEPLSEVEFIGHRDQTLDAFANILRKSFFVSLYGFLESQLTAECRARGKARDDILLSLTDIRGQGVGRAKIYLSKVLQINFSFDTPEWNEIANYRRLRNCIVHNEGIVVGRGMSEKDTRALQAYIEHKQTLSLPHSEVRLERGFCEEVIEVIDRFLSPLFQ